MKVCLFGDIYRGVLCVFAMGPGGRNGADIIARAIEQTSVNQALQPSGAEQDQGGTLQGGGDELR